MNTLTYPTQTPFSAFLLQLFAPLLAMFNENVAPGETERNAPSSKGILDDIFGEGKTVSDIPEDEGDSNGESDDFESDQPDDFDDFGEDEDFEEDDSEDEENDEDEKNDEDDSDDEEDDDSDDEEDDEEDDSDDEEDDEEDDSDDEEDDEEDDSEDEEDDVSESIARKQARERGRKLKILQQEYDDLELKAEEIEDENATLKAEVQKLSSARMSPDDDPTFRSERKAVLDAVEETSLDLPRNGETLKNLYGPLYDRYRGIRELSSDGERREAYEKFKSDIALQFSPFEEPLEELEGEEKREALESVNNVLSLLKAQSARTEELIRMEAELTKKAQQGQIAIGVQDYERNAKTLQGALDSLGNMTEAEIKAEPDSLEAMLTTLVESDPTKAKALKKAKQTVLETVLGAKPYTQSEIDALVEKGHDLAESKRKQNKKVELLRKEVLGKFALFLTMEDVFKESVKTASKAALKESKKDKELVTLAKARRKKKVSKSRPRKTTPKVKLASERPNSAYKIFED